MTFINGSSNAVPVEVAGVVVILGPGVHHLGNNPARVGTIEAGRCGSILVSDDGSVVAGVDVLPEFAAAFGVAVCVGFLVRIWRKFSFTSPHTIDPL